MGWEENMSKRLCQSGFVNAAYACGKIEVLQVLCSDEKILNRFRDFPCRKRSPCR